MAGLFGFMNPNKPGKGVDVDAPAKHPFFLFFELCWRKFSRLVVLNLIFFICVLPIISFIYLRLYEMINTLLPEYIQAFMAEAVAAGQEAVSPVTPLPTFLFSILAMLPGFVNILLLCVSVILYGPVTCGFIYMLRNYTRQEHAWLSDFFVQIKKNFVQGMIAGLIEIGAVSLMVYNLLMQPGDVSEGMSVFFNIIKYVSIVLLILVLFAKNYIYIMIVTFQMKLSSIIRNGFLFSFIGLFRNILILAVTAIFFIAILLVPFADVILIPLFMFSFCSFLATFACYPIIHKLMIKPTLPPEEEDEPEPPEDETPRVDPWLLGKE